jgi:hypothetical protein
VTAVLLGQPLGACVPAGAPPAEPSAAVVLVSLDGWRWDYDTLAPAPSLALMRALDLPPARPGRRRPAFRRRAGAIGAARSSFSSHTNRLMEVTSNSSSVKPLSSRAGGTCPPVSSWEARVSMVTATTV